MSKVGFKVFAPATIGNLGVGFDILGMAITGPGDEVFIREGSEKGIHIKKITGAKGKLPYDPKLNIATIAAQNLLDDTDFKDLAINMEVRKKMPFGSGMGSSAASASAGAYAMNVFLNNPFSDKEIIKYAVAAEAVAHGAYHADSVAPCILGGIVLTRDNATLDIVPLPSPIGLQVLVIHPNIKIFTKDTRDQLPKEIGLETHTRQAGNLAALVASFYKSDFDLLSRSLEDIIIEPHRSKNIPHFDAIKQIAMDQGALAFSISGAGPAMFALTNNSLISENIRDHLYQFYFDKKEEVSFYLSQINTQGTYKV